MKKRIYMTLLALGALSLSGCNDFLQPDMTTKVSDKMAFSKVEYAQGYLDDMYRYLPLYFSFNTDDSTVGLTEGMTDTFKYGSSVAGTNMGFANQFVLGDIGFNFTAVSFHLGAWATTYDRIRRVNEFLFLMDKYAEFDAATIESFRAQARFIRAFLYWQLLKRTDPVLIYPEDMEKVQKDNPLGTSEQCWDYVGDDLDFAAGVLPAAWGENDFGRVTKGAAFAMKSRAMLYAGRWEEAKAAADSVFKFDYVLVDGRTWQNYNKAFDSGRNGNTEAILEFRYNNPYPRHNFDVTFSPRGDGNGEIPGRGAATPTQEMVESFEKAGGGHIDWTPWHTVAGTTATPPYDQLEPRFHANILYNGAQWKGRTIEPFVDGADGWSDFGVSYIPEGRSVTGYYLRKLIDENHASFTNDSPGTKPAILIRLAEVYLNHAEACFRMNNEAGARASLKEVRARVDLPTDDGLSGEALMDAIRRERKVELCYEGHLYWDMKRWKLAHIEYNGPGSRVHGFRIVREGNVDTYYYIDCDKRDRVFPEKLYRIPLPEGEVNNNKGLQQFTEWL